MNATKHKFSVDNCRNSYFFDLFTKVVQSTKGHPKVILTDFGSWVVQGAWSDTTGWYVSYRPEPSWVSRMPDRRNELSAAYNEELSGLFQKEPFEVESNDASIESIITVYFKEGQYSIGD